METPDTPRNGGDSSLLHRPGYYTSTWRSVSGSYLQNYTPCISRSGNRRSGNSSLHTSRSQPEKNPSETISRERKDTIHGTRKIRSLKLLSISIKIRFGQKGDHQVGDHSEITECLVTPEFIYQITYWYRLMTLFLVLNTLVTARSPSLMGGTLDHLRLGVNLFTNSVASFLISLLFYLIPELVAMLVLIA